MGGSPQFQRRELLMAPGGEPCILIMASRDQAEEPAGKELDEEQTNNTRSAALRGPILAGRAVGRGARGRRSRKIVRTTCSEY